LNRTLLTFAGLLILLGLGFGIYVVSLFGLLLIFPALIAGSRPPTRPAPQPAREEPRRIAPPPYSQPQVAVPQTPPMAAPQTPPAMQSLTYSPALFPTPLLSTLAPMASPPPSVKERQDGKPEERDELVEVGTILVFLKLFFG
jgi:hypothetical protein